MAKKGQRFGGKPKGFKAQKTLEKEAARELTRAFVTDRLVPLLEAKYANATGIRHLMMRDESGKFERVAVDANDPQVAAAQIDAALGTGHAFWIYTKDPSEQASKDLLDRAIDKPKEQVQEIKLTSDAELLAKLDRAKQLNREKVKGNAKSPA
jgi:hypothetical protein